MPRTITDFVDTVHQSLTQGTFLTLTLAAPHQSTSDTPRKQTVRPVTIKGEPLLQWELQYQRQEVHENLSAEATLERLQAAFGDTYREAYLFTRDHDVIARASRKGVRIQTRPPSRASVTPPVHHNRSKQYLIPEGEPCPFLISLDVMSPDGRVLKSRQKKFRQINRYLEIVNDVYPSLPAEGTLHVVDFGCGLSYLTFAVHHLLTKIHHRDVNLLGVDQNEHVINRCQTLASDLQLTGLHFMQRDIRHLDGQHNVHLAISLHACDTATDQALVHAVAHRAEVILAAPCCQHELSTHLDCPALEVITRHGILRERFAALATDGLRAAALEAAGYKTQVLEFIDLEHTPKNLLIRAVKRSTDNNGDVDLEKYETLKSTLGVRELATDQILNASNDDR